MNNIKETKIPALKMIPQIDDLPMAQTRGMAEELADVKAYRDMVKEVHAEYEARCDGGAVADVRISKVSKGVDDYVRGMCNTVLTSPRSKTTQTLDLVLKRCEKTSTMGVVCVNLWDTVTGLGLSFLASAMGVSRSHLTKLLSGERVWRASDVKAIRDALVTQFGCIYRGGYELRGYYGVGGALMALVVPESQADRWAAINPAWVAKDKRVIKPGDAIMDGLLLQGVDRFGAAYGVVKLGAEVEIAEEADEDGVERDLVDE